MKLQLNTTDYAILGLLQRRPWSAYELTQYMRESSIKAIWPRAESRLYESPKKLTAMLLAEATKNKVGKRTRTVYRITVAGQAALDEWLAEPGKPLTIEHEAMLKLVFGDINEAAQQQSMLDNIGQQVEQHIEQLQHAYRGLLAHQSHPQDSSPVPSQRVAQNLLVNRYIEELLAGQKKWLSFAKDFDRQWHQCDTEEQKKALISAQYQASLGLDKS
ncbi:hypothetical protein SIN8267_01385 [Sinobacterium norvegicum]|uniref:Transcription regulator PadR N-terminal domain-containing protein n=1 Tax=Sinobacterium norvegicum TaxID=1641715 RepID=A0ABN8EI47_9GAMM|nr:PadR family transcriptional regulator [Sinobacterium norvegicum]CAH0991283.1 hypothetical protein SIN8267_01385 [Sinobacterium norvegicum]